LNRPIQENAMKYLCLVYSDERLLHSSPDSPEDAECWAYAESIQGSGRMVAAEALESVQTATPVRMRNGKLSIIDGPFAETKEQLAGLPDRRQGSQRSDPGRRQHSGGAGRQR
jgi:hypothetical protein